MPVIERERKVAIITALCNGMGLRAASRTFNTHQTAIQDLLVRVGENCERLTADQSLPTRYIAPVGAWTPEAGSSVTAKVSTGPSTRIGATRRLPTPLASTVKTPAGTGALLPTIAQSS
jgi:hypothetical protein